MHRDSLISYLYCLGVASQHFSLSILHTVPVLFPVALGIDLDLSWTHSSLCLRLTSQASLAARGTRVLQFCPVRYKEKE